MQPPQPGSTGTPSQLRNLFDRSGRSVAGFLVLILAFASPVFGQGPSAIGRIKVVAGTVALVRGEATIPVRVGHTLLEADELSTGTDGYVGLTLKDDTRVSLGPDSRLRLDRYVYEPATSQFALGLTIVRGLLAYVSGQIARLSPDAVRLETPASIVGVRGTSLVIHAGRP